MDYIYDGTLYDTTDKLSEEPVFVNSCGFIKGEVLTVVREKGRKDYHIIYVVSGQLEIEIDGESTTLFPNDFAIYLPKQPQRYSAKFPCSRLWIHFSGTFAQSILDKYGFKGGVYRGKEKHEIIDIFREISDEYLMPSEKADIKNAALLQMLLLRLYESVSREKYVNSAVSSLIKLINDDCKSVINVSEFADMAGMSEESFARLFKECTGVPVHRYITGVRLKQALRLLKYSGSTISQIAYAVGYDDPLYFSRLFKKYYGASPSYIRNS